MKPRYLLDTNIISYAVRAGQKPDRHARLIDKIDAAKNRLCVSIITLGELHKGAAKSDNEQSYIEHIDRIRRRYTVLTFDYETARHYGAVTAATTNQPIGSNDAWIAAQALRHRLTLITHNTREFRRIPGLMMEDWV